MWIIIFPGFLLCLCSISEVFARTDIEENIFNKLFSAIKGVVNYASTFLDMYVPPVIRKCWWELRCLFKKDTSWATCFYKVTGCVTKHALGFTNCLYDLGWGVASNIYKHGIYLSEYEYGDILSDIIFCATS